MVDVLVSGSGPAGWALAWRCALLGLHTAIVAPRPEVPWPATYGVWGDELGLLPPDVTAAAPQSMRVVTTRTHQLSRPYAVLDNSRLLDALRLADVEVIGGRVVNAERGAGGCTVRLLDGRSITAAVVVDATGARRTLTGGPPRSPRAEQTAVGVVVPAELAEPVLGPDHAVFMDWTPASSQGVEWPTFLYAVPLGGDRVLLEETSLARRPGLPFRVLRALLHARLATHGVLELAERGQEHVRIPLDVPPPRLWTRHGHAVAFGAAGGMVHPATGYSLGEVFGLAPRVASALRDELPARPSAALAAAAHAAWSPTARMVNLLRRRGMAALLTLPPDQVGAFFSLFFTLPDDLQRAYLSGREDLAGTTAAMAAVFRSAPWSLRARLFAGVSGYR